MSFGNSNVFGQPAAQGNANSMFSQPSAGGDMFSPAEHEGELLLIEPLSFEQGITTQMGTSDAVKANVIVLDGPTAGATFDDALIFPKVLQSQTKPKIGGGYVLGRLGKGEAKPGKSAPWMLHPFNEQDAQTAQNWINSNKSDLPY